MKAYDKDTAGNKSSSDVPGEGGVILMRFFKGVAGVATISLE